MFIRIYIYTYTMIAVMKRCNLFSELLLTQVMVTHIFLALLRPSSVLDGVALSSNAERCTNGSERCVM